MRLLLLMLSLFVGSAAYAKPTLVATLPDLGAIARAVVGDDWNVVVLADPNQDPHYVDPRPSFLVTLAKADALLFNGLELEIGWLPPLLTNARNTKIQPGGIGHIDASGFVLNKLGVPAKVDRAMGDIHAGGNPHYTIGPAAAAEIARGLSGHMTLLDGTRAAAYRARADAFIKELDALALAEQQRFAALPPEKKRVVVYHDSLPYLVQWLGIEQVATVENKPGIKPSPAHVAQVLDTMRARGAKVILQEKWHPDTVSKNLATTAGARLVTLQGGAEPKQSYIARMSALAKVVYDALAQ